MAQEAVAVQGRDGLFGSADEVLVGLLEGRAVQVTLQPPQGTAWKVATQLHPTGDPYTFTAANLQYLIDSPIEVSNFTLRSFSVPEVFRIALHHDGTEQEVDRLTADVERIVREERAIFGEFPKFENPYTFIGDFLPYAHRDGMEHRNSTVMTGAAASRASSSSYCGSPCASPSRQR